jgi:hypothetical protein
VRTVLGLVGLVLLLSCAVPILLGWRNPESRFLVGFVQTRDARSKDPKRTAAAACWLILGFAAGAVGAMTSWEANEPLSDASPPNLVGYFTGAVAVACLGVAAYVRFGDAPQSLRPAAMRTGSQQG